MLTDDPVDHGSGNYDAVSDAQCPGSPAEVHAKCTMSVMFAEHCAVVKQEIEIRMSGFDDEFVDPHNHGHYHKTWSDGAHGTHTRGYRETGDGGYDEGVYMDRIFLTYENLEAGDGCMVTACSESQHTSVLDFSTNYCNLHNLWCGASEGCPYVHEPSLTYQETVLDGTCAASTSGGLVQQHDPSKCLSSSPPPTALQPAGTPSGHSPPPEPLKKHPPPPPLDLAGGALGSATAEVSMPQGLALVLFGVAIAAVVLASLVCLWRRKPAVPPTALVSQYGGASASGASASGASSSGAASRGGWASSATSELTGEDAYSMELNDAAAAAGVPTTRF